MNDRQNDAKSRSLFSIVFMPTLRCNCTCSHCFEKLTAVSMDDSLYEKVFEALRAIANEVACDTLRIYWQGGEVLSMSPESVRNALYEEQRVFAGSGVKTERHLQTNLMPYESRRWRDIVRLFDVNTVSSSLDFPNLYRKTAGIGPEQYNAVWLKKKAEVEADGFAVSVISLINRGTLEIGARRFYDFYEREARVKNLQINLPFPGYNVEPRPLDRDALTRFVIELYRIWIERGRSLNLSPFKALEERILDRPTPILCGFSYSCAKSLIAVGPRGEVGQCDCWVCTFPEHNYGSLFTHSARELLEAQSRRAFVDRALLLASQTKCGECRFFQVCYGGCPIRAFALNGNMHTPDYYCPVYFELFSTILDQGELQWKASHDAI
ncbi:MAG: radical SAM protein [Deltaproteobacteria bacterium]|nr:radical SAM protein [Deltaproteobacteria bacterium]